MISIYECASLNDFKKIPRRNISAVEGVEGAVADILENVRSRGDEALREYTWKFDGVSLDSFEVSREEIEEAYTAADTDFIGILSRARENIYAFHEKQKKEGFIIADEPGIVLGQRVMPVDRAGMYVPGGTASYPSTVLMDAIPAKIAGVGELIMTTPPNPDGKLSNDILAAARLAGVDRIFKLGGSQAIAAMAYGTESVPGVDKIVGPGNIYVATAKRMVCGMVGIDMVAGPSEILIIADETANPDYVAMDMLSQAEHDPLAAAVLVATDRNLAHETCKALKLYSEKLPRIRTIRASIEKNSAIIITGSLNIAAEISNEIAPEHLELCVKDPFALFSAIRHAGSVFLGKYAPNALGDYFAGPNHTLPTGGAARYSSPLSVDDFTKKASFIYYDKNALAQSSRAIADFARREGLQAHAQSVMMRLEERLGDK